MIIGINGSYGFIGYHLWLYLNYKCDERFPNERL